MSDAPTRRKTIGLTASLLAITLAFPVLAAQQGTTDLNAQDRGSSGGGFATPSPGRDRLDAATGAELVRRRLELIKQVVPGVARIAVLWQPGVDNGHPMTALQDVGKAAWALGLHLRFLAADNVPQLEEAFSDISTGGVDAVLVISSRMLLLEREYIVQMVAKTGLPAIYESREFVESGGLMSYGPSLTELDQYNTPRADKIMAGDNTAQDRPIKLELVVNMKTANRLRMVFDSEFLRAVDEIID
jgi:putative tryptophan/tyrosine transport system substrate-binding protein